MDKVTRLMDAIRIASCFIDAGGFDLQTAQSAERLMKIPAIRKRWTARRTEGQGRIRQ